MTSDVKIEANRRNARRSSGPKTEQGKANSRMNALKWGLFVRERLIDGEDRSAFLALSVDLNAELCPEGEFQRHLVQEISWDMWRLQRLDRAEFALLDDARTARYALAHKMLSPQEAKLMELLDPERADASREAQSTSSRSSTAGNLWLHVLRKDGLRFEVPVPPGYDKEFVQTLQTKIDHIESVGNGILDAVADERQIFERLNRIRQGLTKNIRSHYQMLGEIQKR
jgi:ABC-type transporter Mla MlaB component